MAAYSFDHGGRTQEAFGLLPPFGFGRGLPFSSTPYSGAENVKNGPSPSVMDPSGATPWTLPRSYGCDEPADSPAKFTRSITPVCGFGRARGRGCVHPTSVVFCAFT